MSETHTPRTLSKINIHRLAKDLAKATTSNDRCLDAGALAERLWKATRRGVLCEKPGYVFALYSPGEHSDPVIRTGLKDGQSRFFAYSLCVKCFGVGYQSEDVTEQVEDKIADRFVEEANVRPAARRLGRLLHQREHAGRYTVAASGRTIWG